MDGWKNEMKVYTRSQTGLISFVERQQRVHSTKLEVVIMQVFCRCIRC